MKIRIIKPQIPIIFIDTFFFIDLVANRYREDKSAYYAEEMELVELIAKLTNEKKILCPQGDQEEEYKLGIQNIEEIQKEQTRLSLGISVMYHYGVHKYQTKQAVSAYVKNENEIVYDYRSLFHREPVKELEEALNQRWIIGVHSQTPKTFLDKQRKTKKELAKEFERLRQEKIISVTKYREAFQLELLGQLGAIRHTLQKVMPKLLAQQLLSEEESNGLLILGDYLSTLSHYSGKEATIDDVAKFLESEYLASVPFLSIQSKLYASLLTQKNPVKDTDNFDFQQASQMLPFSTYFLTDSALKHRLTTNPLALGREYGVKIYSMREINDLIKELKKL